MSGGRVIAGIGLVLLLAVWITLGKSIERFVNLVLEKKIDLRRILAVTFTNKAAREMKQRIQQEFADRGHAELSRQVEFASISTMHAFNGVSAWKTSAPLAGFSFLAPYNAEAPAAPAASQLWSLDMAESKKKAYKITNWAKYNESLVRRGDITMWFDEDVINQWEHENHKNP